MAIEFAVWHEGMAEGTGRWVLAVDAHDDMLLLCDGADNSLYWKDRADCTLVNAHTPDAPTLVLPVEVSTQSQQAGLVLPAPNRQMRRNGGF